MEIGIVLLAFLSSLFHAAGAQVTLAWDRNPEPDVAGYKVYYGTPAGSYSTVVDVSNVTNYAVLNLTPGASYSFYVTCYNTAGLESDPSNVVQYGVPEAVMPITVTTRSTPFGPVMELTWDADVGSTYRVLYKNDLNARTWRLLEEFDAAGTSAYYTLDPTSSTAPTRFFQVQRAQ